MAGDFPSITRNDVLEAELRQRIAREGAISFRDFMDTALYHPRHGYYTTHADAPSSRGDYVTSPEVHPVFGSLIARQLHQMWDLMGRPASFDLVEAGAGGGLLARDILRRAARLDDAFAAALRYTIVESSPAMRARQQRILGDAGLDEAVAWQDALPHTFSGCVLSNELLDAFPFHRVAVRNGVLHEVCVTLEGERFTESLHPAPDALHAYFDALGLRPGEGCYAEVNLEAPRWIAEVARSLSRGYVITFDYGYEARDLYAPWRRDGTLLCFYRQSVGTDPYAHVGHQDMTASIDFTTLRSAAGAAGLREIGYTTQSDVLVRLGIGEGIASVAGEGGVQLEEYFARRNVVLDLIDPAKLGRIRVLAHAKDVSHGPLRGFSDE